jgi:hypothetical protein
MGDIGVTDHDEQKSKSGKVCFEMLWLHSVYSFPLNGEEKRSSLLAYTPLLGRAALINSKQTPNAKTIGRALQPGVKNLFFQSGHIICHFKGTRQILQGSFKIFS